MKRSIYILSLFLGAFLISCADSSEGDAGTTQTPSEETAPPSDEPSPTPPSDNDGDGYGASDDCNDLDAAIHPGADELCNGEDDDCDGAVDNDALDADIYYEDSDRDGYGDATSTSRSCDDAPTGYVSNGDDCNDRSPTVYPGAADICDGNADNDCDGRPDASETDQDGDGFSSCDGDCDDADPERSPDTPEICDQMDNDCDGQIDEDTPSRAYWPDRDGDGYGDATADPQEGECADPLPEGYADNASDCDDTNPAVHPGAEDICDEVADNDCDGESDPLEADLDGDGASACAGDCDDADPERAPGLTESCNALDDDCDGEIPAEELDADGDGFSSCDGDCDDADPAISPTEAEVCDALDHDCDGDAYNGLDAQTWYIDADGDTYGDPASAITTCDGAPDDAHITQGEDCDDGNASVYPGADDTCDDVVDNNCDGLIDALEEDNDGDAFTECEGDCDDSNSSTYPGADELCDGRDNDCDGTGNDMGTPTEVWADNDGDGYGDPAAAETVCAVPDEGYATNGDDCDDGDASTHPGADEVCDGTPDNNCDGQPDALEIDDDGDGQSECDLDCDDTDPTNASGQAEVCDGRDNDCDGVADNGLTEPYYVDEDGDGYGDPDTQTEACDGPPDGYVADDTDCDDTDPSIHPDADELEGDAIDNDCDGVSDADAFVSLDGEAVEGDKPVFTRIQAAIDASSDGDIIGVLPGTYDENVDFSGKNVTVVSIEGADATTIDGGLRSSVVRFIHEETPEARLSGFTLTRGTGSLGQDCGVGVTTLFGGGVCIDGASPTLSDLIITQNSAEYGAGIFSLEGDPILSRIEAFENIASQNGGGFFLEYGDPLVEDSSLHDNSAVQGAGLTIYYGFPQINDTSIEANTATDDGGGIYLLEAGPTFSHVLIAGNASYYYGGGGYLNTADAHFSQTIIRDNTAVIGGGGLSLAYADPTFTHVLIQANMAGTDGGGIWMDDSNPDMTQVIFRDNDAGYGGGGLYTSNSAPTLSNVVFMGNTATTVGGALYSSFSIGTIRNSILAYNQAGEGANVYVYSDLQPTLNYDCLQTALGTAGISGMVLGTDNLIVDPQVLDDPLDGDSTNDDYHLSSSSPLIDAGNPDDSHNDPDGSRNDIGAYGGAEAANWDLDGDGYTQWWNPQVGFQEGVDDCDDQDPDVNVGEGCAAE